MTLPEYYNGISWIPIVGTVTSIAITSGSSGLAVSGSPITTNGTINLTLGSELQTLSAFASTGLITRTGSNSYAGRTLIGSTGINIVNGDGIFGNPTFSVSTIDINTNTTGFLAINRLAGYAAAPTTTFLKGDSTWSLVDINNNTTGSLLASRISGYPSNSSLFLNGLGSWTAPSFSNLITTSAATYALTINNTNASATATSFYIQNNGVGAAEFGFNNSTNEAYVWSSGTATIKFGTNSTTRARILNSGTFDLLTNDLITTGSINAQTGTLKGNNLAVHNSSSINVLNNLAMGNNSITGLATPISSQDAVTKNYADTSTITASRISGYPSNSSLFLNGLGSWVAPSFPNLITTSASSYAITLNNTNASATDTGFIIQNNGSIASAFGFNNSTNEAYAWAYGTSSLKFGTANTKRMQLLNNGTLDLLTNNLITSGNISATTGTLIGNNLAAYNSGSIVVLNPLAMNNNYITGLANPVNPQDAATKSYADSVGTGTNKSILHGYNAATYSINVGVGDHLKFDNFAFARGTAITLDTSSSYNTSTGTASIGRITLAAGKTYKLTGSINNVVSASYNATRWYNSDTGAALGLISGSPSPISTTDRAPSAETVAYVVVSSTTRVELRITWNAFSSVNGTGDAIGTAWFTAEEV